MSETTPRTPITDTLDAQTKQDLIDAFGILGTGPDGAVIILEAMLNTVGYDAGSNLGGFTAVQILAVAEFGLSRRALQMGQPLLAGAAYLDAYDAMFPPDWDA